MDKESLLNWAREEAKKADKHAHDMSTGTSPGADSQRSLQWGRAAAFYELIGRLEEE